MMENNSNNLGSVTGLKYALLDDIYSISRPNDQHQVNVTFFPGKDFVDIPFQSQSASFNESEKESAAGLLIAQELSFDFMNINPETMLLHRFLMNKPLVFLIIDGNGNQMILGSRDNPAYIKMSAVRKSKPENPTKYKVGVSRQSNKLAYYYPREDSPGLPSPG